MTKFQEIHDEFGEIADLDVYGPWRTLRQPFAMILLIQSGFHCENLHIGGENLMVLATRTKRFVI